MVTNMKGIFFKRNERGKLDYQKVEPQKLIQPSSLPILAKYTVNLSIYTDSSMKTNHKILSICTFHKSK